MKAYAVTTKYRLASLPDVPTMQEAGLPDYDASQWFAVATTHGVAADRIEKLNGLLAEIVGTAEFKEALDAAGMIAGQGSAADLQEFVSADDEKWSNLLKSTNLSLIQ